MPVFDPELRKETVAFTGYRPEKIRLSSSNPDIEQEIRSALNVMIRDLYGRGYRRFLSGMAEGFDLWAAGEVLDLKASGECPGIELWAIVPFRGQERNYQVDSLESYRRVLDEASEVVVLAEHYCPECYRRRNDWLVENASLAVCYFDGQPGGTQYTVRKARKAGLPVINLLSPSLPLL